MGIPQDILGLDLAAFRTLRLVYRLRSFSEASDELGLKQSTVSYTIDRIRKVLNDPLFVRQGRGIAPTERCEDIIPHVDLLLNQAEEMSVAGKFDPATATGHVRISAPEYARNTFLLPALKTISMRAPKITIDLFSGYMNVTEILFDGKAEIAFSPILPERSGIYSKDMLQDTYVCVLDRDNPLVQKDWNLEDFARARHVGLKLGPSFLPSYMEVARAAGMDLKFAITSPYSYGILDLVSGTDLVGTVASRMLPKELGRLVVKKCPVHTSVNGAMHWAASTHRSPLLSWIRDVVSECALAMPPPVEL